VIVIDASALAKYVLREPGWKTIRDVLAKGVYSIDLVVKEVANAIWKRACVLRLEPVEKAAKRYNVLRRLVDEQVIVLEDELAYLDRAFRISMEAGIPIYDALYIAQSLVKNAVLVTGDGRRASVAEKLGARVHLVS
jgi:predicted nucleic acid-binding protein